MVGVYHVNIAHYQISHLIWDGENNSLNKVKFLIFNAIKTPTFIKRYFLGLILNDLL